MRVEARRLQAWRDEFVASGIEGLKGKPLAPGGCRLKEAERGVRVGRKRVLRLMRQASGSPGRTAGR